MAGIISAFALPSNYPVETAVQSSAIISPGFTYSLEINQETPMLFDQMDKEMVKALIETIPAEISIIDANDEVVGWNKHETRLFKRPMTTMGLNFRECHPQKSLEIVERLVGEMKGGERDKARFWIDLAVPNDTRKHKILIEFFALRNSSRKYLGCLEFVQDVQDIRRLAGEKRLMD